MVRNRETMLDLSIDDSFARQVRTAAEVTNLIAAMWKHSQADHATTR